MAKQQDPGQTPGLKKRQQELAQAKARLQRLRSRRASASSVTAAEQEVATAERALERQEAESARRRAEAETIPGGVRRRRAAEEAIGREAGVGPVRTKNLRKGN